MLSLYLNWSDYWLAYIIIIILLFKLAWLLARFYNNYYPFILMTDWQRWLHMGRKSTACCRRARSTAPMRPPALVFWCRVWCCKWIKHSLHWKEKWSHFDLKSWVTGGTKIQPGLLSNWRIFASLWLDIES